MENTQEREELLVLIGKSLESGDLDKTAELIKKYRPEWGYGAGIAVMEAQAAIVTGRADDALCCLYRGISCDSRDFELYYMLGEVYEMTDRPKQAEICYRYALFLCPEQEDRECILENIKEFQGSHPFRQTVVTVILQTESDEKWLELCLDKIGQYFPAESCQVILTAGNPSVEVSRWAEDHEDGVKSVFTEGASPGEACNVAIDGAAPSSDILLIREGALPLEHVFFNLLMELRGDENTAAAAGFYSLLPEPGERIESADLDAAIAAASERNLASFEPGEEQILLFSPVTLIRRQALKRCGWFDSRFSSLTHQMCDLGFRFLFNGYRLKFCPNALVCAWRDPAGMLADRNLADQFYQKWKVDLTYSCHARNELVNLMEARKDSKLRVLEVGCACGGTLLSVRNRWPQAALYGIERSSGPAAMASNFASVLCGDLETAVLDYPNGSFDYILFGDVLEHLRDPKAALLKLLPFLKKGGRILTSLPNVMHISVVRDLLNGNWTYREAGILDRTHLRFFTYFEILKMFEDCGCKVIHAYSTAIPISGEDEALIQKLCAMGAALEQFFKAYQYIVEAEAVAD